METKDEEKIHEAKASGNQSLEKWTKSLMACLESQQLDGFFAQEGLMRMKLGTVEGEKLAGQIVEVLNGQEYPDQKEKSREFVILREPGRLMRLTLAGRVEDVGPDPGMYDIFVVKVSKETSCLSV